ncbi:L domain-like protein kinase superfamily [Klebsormidium nitens]|uniref:L domain-like protein kinase superfamily n=1 Tax=Klebsormidium nitens TaxID=105231 RepID=A0A1Y1IA63_KLENI|nr:L domain-like protein kinase superfamily [Klebsormidium nitens]|eukprot:GAQ85586.1 L domain-like protein kinase superfamily [Klebsormidium nitens]
MGPLKLPRNIFLVLFLAIMTCHVSCFTISDLQKLTSVRLSNETSLDLCTDPKTANALSGPIPIELGLLTKLTSLQICNQNLTGGIPPQLGHLTGLTMLNLTGNRLTGVIPVALAGLTLLKTLALQNNQLSGGIPPALAAIQNLENLVLYNNSLSGGIPAELGGLTRLTNLFLQNNSLSGSMPASLGNLTQMQTLVLEYNQLTGPIPTEFGGLLQASLLSLAANQLTGTIPRSLQLMVNLRNLYLPNNNLTGAIPPELSQLTRLETLNLAGNALSGPIPPSLANPPNLTKLILVNNDLTGVIPPGFLARFGFANILPGNSQLSVYGSPGNPPLTTAPNPAPNPPFLANPPSISGPQFPPEPPSPAPNNSAVASEPSVNPGALGVTPSPTETPKAEDTHPRLVVTAVVVTNVCLVTLFITLAAVFYYRRKAKRNARAAGTPDVELGKDEPRPAAPAAALAGAHSPSSDNSMFSTSDSSPPAFSMSGKEPPAPPPASARTRARIVPPEDLPTPASLFHRTFSLAELREATENFSPNNLVDSGSSATVYRGSLPDGSPVAVKRLNPDGGLDERAWRAELAALSKARHRNLVPLLGVCAEAGERLLVLEYFSGGSLRQRLGAGATPLTWDERVNVVEGVCRGLAYLHHDITPPLIHRQEVYFRREASSSASALSSNVKPANVLLRGSGRALDACIGDFGLACLVRDRHSDVLPYETPAAGSKFVSAKRDVYSFGVLVLEILTGRPVFEAAGIANGAPGDAEALLEAASRAVLKDGQGLEVLDPAIADACDALEAERCISIALECLQQVPDSRPTMESVNLRLKTMRSRRFMRQRSGVPGASPRFASPRAEVVGASPRYYNARAELTGMTSARAELPGMASARGEVVGASPRYTSPQSRRTIGMSPRYATPPSR